MTSLLDGFARVQARAGRAAADAGTDAGASAAERNPQGEADSERFVARVVVFGRLVALAHLTMSLVVGYERFGPAGVGTGAVVLAVATSAEGLLLITWIWRSELVRPRWALADGAYCCVALLVGAALAHQDGGFDPWVFVFPLSISTAMVIGAAFRQLSHVLLCQAAPTVVYIVCAYAYRRLGSWNVPQDCVTYLGFASAQWALAMLLRRQGRALDEAQARAILRQAELAAERERSRYFRDLHDRVLQTLEVLARGRFLSDPRMMARVSREAFWLRRLVEGNPPSADGNPDDLAAALAGVIENHVDNGMRIELHTNRLRRTLPAETIQALASAVGESLTNVRKHSGVEQAVVRAASVPDGVVVSVLDRGCGFDPAGVNGGLGLRESIFGRVTHVGGQVQVDSSADAGTCIEMWVPHEPTGPR